jgi:hypothetical protein
MQTGYSIRKRQVNPLAAFLALAFVRDQQLLRRVWFPPVKTSSHCGVANSSLILFVVVFSLHTMVPARESDPENRDFKGRDNDC